LRRLGVLLELDEVELQKGLVQQRSASLRVENCANRRLDRRDLLNIRGGQP